MPKAPPARSAATHRTTRHRTLQRAQRLSQLAILLLLLTIGLVVAQTAGYGWGDVEQLLPREWFGPFWNRQIALISGHAGNDSGAICTDEAGEVTVTEAAINAAVVAEVARRLTEAGADPVILDEFDDRLDGLAADVMLSIHADSCIDASGYKAAIFTRSRIPAISGRLLECIDSRYPAVTGLPHHPNTVTHNMTEYHAFRQIDAKTPAAIIEMGFLGGDQKILTTQPGVLADAIIASLDCFFGAEPAAGPGGELDAGAGSAAPPDADNGATPTTEEGNGS